MTNPDLGRDKLRQALAEFTTEYYNERSSMAPVPVPELRLPGIKRAFTTRTLSRIRLAGRQVASFAFSLLLILILRAPAAELIQGISMPEFLWRTEQDRIVVFYDEFDRSNATPLKPNLVPGYIPEDFVTISHGFSDDQYVRIYKNGRGDLLKIVQGTFEAELSFSCEGLAPSTVYRDGQQILFGHNGDHSVYVWGGRDSIFMLTVYGTMEEDKILQIVDEYERGETESVLQKGK